MCLSDMIILDYIANSPAAYCYRLISYAKSVQLMSLYLRIITDLLLMSIGFFTLV